MTGLVIFAAGFAAGVLTLLLMTFISAARDMEDEHQ